MKLCRNCQTQPVAGKAWNAKYCRTCAPLSKHGRLARPAEAKRDRYYVSHDPHMCSLEKLYFSAAEIKRLAGLPEPYGWRPGTLFSKAGKFYRLGPGGGLVALDYLKGSGNYARDL